MLQREQRHWNFDSHQFLFYSPDEAKESHGEVLATGQNPVMMGMNSVGWPANGSRFSRRHGVFHVSYYPGRQQRALRILKLKNDSALPTARHQN
jgi:hypothetical protein